MPILPAPDAFLSYALQLLLPLAVFVLAGVVKGVIGLGLPTIAMGLLALVMTPAQAAALLIIPSLVTNVWQMQPWSTVLPLLRRLLPMQLAAVAGTIGGAWWLGAPSGTWAGIALGLALVGYAAWGLLRAQVSVSPAAETWMGPLVGLATGVVTAATGVFVIPAVPYLQAIGLQRDALIQAMGISFTISTIALAAGLAANDSYGAADLGISLLMLAPAIAGMACGQWLRRRISQPAFRRLFLSSLALLGGYMIARAWWT